MNKDLAVSESVEVNVPPSKVWEALTKPELISEYLFGTNTTTDWKPGSKINFEGEYEGTKYNDHGVVMENDPEKLLSYTYWSSMTGLEDKPENYSLVTYKIDRIDDNRSKFTWVQQGFKDEKSYEHTKTSMKSFLESVKNVMEK